MLTETLSARDRGSINPMQDANQPVADMGLGVDNSLESTKIAAVGVSIETMNLNNQALMGVHRDEVILALATHLVDGTFELSPRDYSEMADGIKQPIVSDLGSTGPIKDYTHKDLGLIHKA